MPNKSKKPCAYPGCPELVTDGRFCLYHKKQVVKQYDKQRGSATSRGYDSQWRKARLAYLGEHPLCECDECVSLKRTRAASVIDHRIPHRGDPVLFWDKNNWQAMAKLCHDSKTAKEDGGFGNPRH